jgi:DNA-binding response OmpR family regulator
MARDTLKGDVILIVEEQPLIALDVQTALEAAGAEVHVARNAAEALTRIASCDFSAGVVDWRPDSDDHRVVARALKQKNVRFLFYATQQPDDVTTIRGAPIYYKPAQADEIVKALRLLIAAD